MNDEIRDITFPVVVRATGAPAGESIAADGGDADADEAMTDAVLSDETAGPAVDPKAEAGQPAGARGRRDADASLDSIDAFVEFFIAAGAPRHG